MPLNIVRIYPILVDEFTCLSDHSVIDKIITSIDDGISLFENFEVYARRTFKRRINGGLLNEYLIIDNACNHLWVYPDFLNKYLPRQFAYFAFTEEIAMTVDPDNIDYLGDINQFD